MASDAFSYISTMPHFSFLPKEDQEIIAAGASAVHLDGGTTYARQRQTSIESILVVTSGELALYEEKAGKLEPSGFIKEGEVFGGITILLNAGISLRTAVAERDCDGFSIPKKLFQDLCRRHRDFYEFFLKNFSKNIFDDSLADIIETGQMLRFISGTVPFSFLSEEETEKLLPHFSVVRHPKGAVLFVQGKTRIGYLYILQKGAAERFFEENGKKTMREMLGEGDMYGGISMLVNGGISVRTLQITEPSIFYLLPQKQFLDICHSNDTFTEYFTDIFGRRMLQKSYSAIIAKTMRPKEDGLLLLNQPVSAICSRKPISGPPTLSIQETARLMEKERISSLFIRDENGEYEGVVTERDLARRVIAEGYDVSRPVVNVMSSPVRAISDKAMVFEAMMKMMQDDVRHLAVENTGGDIVGIISGRDILVSQSSSPIFLLREIDTAESVEELVAVQQRMPELVRNLISGGAMARNVNRVITTVSDAILQRVISFTIDEIGHPPARFSFMVMGSEGRSEQTLKTDQDNAIVYEEPKKGDESKIREYFLKFGERCCDMLNDAGYAFCTGGVMAKNPKWCQPLSVWKQYFHEWIHAAQPEDLLQASIFFDFSFGFGDRELIRSLRRYLFNSLENWSGFFRHLSENALHFRPPLGFFRNFVVESKGEHKNAFDIKGAMTCIVDFTRVYALKHRIEDTNTVERLTQLRIKNVITPEDCEELETAYGFLMQQRFARQVAAVLEENGKPDNYINPKKLTRIEQTMLKEIFVRIEKFQSRLELDFIGMV